MNKSYNVRKMLFALRGKFKYKIFIISLLAVSVPIIVFGFVSYKMTSARIENDFIKYKQNLNRQLMQNISENIKNLSRQSMAVFANIDDVTYILSKPSDAPDVAYLETSLRISRFFQSILQGNEKLYGVTLIDLDGEIRFCYTRNGAALNLFKVNEETWYKDTLALKGSPLLREPHLNEFLDVSRHSDDTVISISRALLDFDTNKVNGVLLIDQNIDQFSGVLTNLALESDEIVTILGKTNDVIYTNNPSSQLDYEAIMDTIDDASSGSFTMKIDNFEQLVTHYYSDEYGWRVVSLLPMTQLHAKSLFIRDIFVLLILVLLISVFLISVLISYLVNKPLKKLKYSFGRLQKGDFNTYVPVRGSDEFAEIGSTFNAMVVDIKSLIQQKYELSILRKQSELESLQSQINPHFLFNTLNTIGAVSDEGDVEKVGIMLRRLADIFRYSLNRGQNNVTFFEELEQTKKYLYIQECRFEGKYSVDFNIDPEVLDLQIPRLTLQPLVENAIYHGLERSLGYGELIISAKTSGNNYDIDVINSGILMTADELATINAQLDSDPAVMPNLTPQKLGIFNVNARIKFSFGNDYGLHFSTRSDAYTVVKVSLLSRKNDLVSSS